jgi:hypothetical protein
MNSLASVVSTTSAKTVVANAIVPYVRQNGGLGTAFKNFGANLSGAASGALPGTAQELLHASSLGPGIKQILQEFFMQFIPKATLSAFIRPAMISYEILLEAPEYGLLYLLPPFVAVACAKAMKDMLGLPHFELLGQPLHKLKKNIGQEISIGSFKPAKVKIDNALISRISFGRFMLFLVAAGAGIAGQLIATAPRVLLIKNFTKIFNKNTGGTDNFYAISGLDVPECQKQGGEEAKEATRHAKENLWWGISYLLFSVPALLGLTKLFAKRIGPNGRFNRISEVFTLDQKFGVSKIMTLFNLVIAPWAYARTALNKAGMAEDLNRLILFSIPAVLFFQQLAGNFLTWMGAKSLSLKASGKDGVVSSWKDYGRELREGKREALNLGLIDLHKSGNQFSGRIERLPQIQELKLKDPALYRRALGRLHFLNEWGVYIVALGWGLSLNWLNFLNTVKRHDGEMVTYASRNKTSGFASSLTQIQALAGAN